MEDLKSDFLDISKGDPQGSILGAILFSVYISDLGKDIQAKKHFYADDTIIYALAPSITQAVKELQTAFQSLEGA